MENFYAQKQLIKAEWGQLYYYRKNYYLMALATNFKDILQIFPRNISLTSYFIIPKHIF